MRATGCPQRPFSVPPSPRHRTRATRDHGRRTREALLASARRLFAERGWHGVTTADIAAAADAFPSQVTYYFGSKEALFVEAACREVLELGAAVERAGASATTRLDYARALVRTALASPALPRFAEALTLARQHPELAAHVAGTLERLHREGARAWEETCRRRRWRRRATGDAVARGFWAQLLGLCVEFAACGEAVDVAAAEAAVLATLRLDGVRPVSSGPSRRRR